MGLARGYRLNVGNAVLCIHGESVPLGRSLALAAKNTMMFALNVPTFSIRAGGFIHGGATVSKHA